MPLLILTVVASIAILFNPTHAYAYLDPGSGSVLLQLLLGGVAGLAVAIKLFWRRLLAFFGAKRSEQNKDHVERP